MIKKYPIDQSPLFRVGSKKKLAEILGLPLSRILALKDPVTQYRERHKQVKNKLRIIHLPLADRMKVHRRIFSLLVRISPPSYLHSGIKERSFKTNAAAHQQCKELLKLDLKNFYPSTTLLDVKNCFTHIFKCPNDVAELLARLCCYENQVPVGSPVSQVIAFFAHKNLFDDLHSIAEKEGVTFTCYVDDLTFSGLHIPKGLAHKLHQRIEKTNLAWHKQRLFRSSEAKEVTGVIITPNNCLKIPNKKHQRIATLIRELHASSSLEDYAEKLRRLDGLLGYRNYVDPTGRPLATPKVPKKLVLEGAREI